jgi:hypothetical protein
MRNFYDIKTDKNKVPIPFFLTAMIFRIQTV